MLDKIVDRGRFFGLFRFRLLVELFLRHVKISSSLIDCIVSSCS
jgi:hypothetical protein